MSIVYYLIGGAAFFGILAWFIERKRGKPFTVEGDARVPFSHVEQEKVRIETEIVTRSHTPRH